ncbi:MAG: hypothetical protein ACRCXT_00405 [Paraclostridium sp.]|uniref:hypothetical protein n=1 Tax=Cetobacterium sp. TaxID=2071632 RepID=UPI003F30BA05
MKKIIHKFIFKGSEKDIFCGKNFIQDGILYKASGYGYTTWGVYMKYYVDEGNQQYLVRYRFDSKQKKYRIDRLFRAVTHMNNDTVYTEKHNGKYISIYKNAKKKHKKAIQRVLDGRE